MNSVQAPIVNINTQYSNKQTNKNPFPLFLIPVQQGCSKSEFHCTAFQKRSHKPLLLVLSASWHPCYKFRTWHMLKNPIRKAFTAFSLCFNYDRAAGNKSANKHFVTWQFSVGWHQGLPGPAWDQCSTSVYQGKKWIMLRNGNRKTRELKTALLFQSGHSFLCFFTAVSSSSCSWNGWWFLASLSWTFTASPHKLLLDPVLSPTS